MVFNPKADSQNMLEVYCKSKLRLNNHFALRTIEGATLHSCNKNFDNALSSVDRGRMPLGGQNAATPT